MKATGVVTERVAYALVWFRDETVQRHRDIAGDLAHVIVLCVGPEDIDVASRRNLSATRPGLALDAMKEAGMAGTVAEYEEAHPKDGLAGPIGYEPERLEKLGGLS